MPSKSRLVTSKLCFALEKAGLLDFSYNNYALEHNFFKNVSKGPAFSRQTEVQTLEYGLDDAMRIK